MRYGKVGVTRSGLEASHVNAKTVEIRSEIGIDISNQTSKALSDFRAEDYDGVISLCGCGVNFPKHGYLEKYLLIGNLKTPKENP